jgi:AcrR family transcriptional regulator
MFRLFSSICIKLVTFSTMETKASDKWEIILAAAKDLFWKHGFKRVTVEEICAKAGISKMTFYRYFQNKTELAKTVFDKTANEGYDQFRLILTENSTPDEKIEKILLLKFEGTHDISQEFLMDFYSDKDSGLKEYVQQKTNEVWQKIISDFKSAQETGVFRRDIKMELFLAISQKMMELLDDQNITDLFSNPQEMIMESARILMYGISPQKK